jgi:hypothetical protein
MLSGSARAAVAVATLATVALLACGPQTQRMPQSSNQYGDVYRTPYPTPFGTAGLSGIPPRPSHRPPWPNTPLPRTQRVAAPEWTSLAAAQESMHAYLPESVWRQSSSLKPRADSRCQGLVYEFMAADAIAEYLQIREALERAGVTLTQDDPGDLRSQGPLRLHAETPSIDFLLYASAQGAGPVRFELKVEPVCAGRYP